MQTHLTYCHPVIQKELSKNSTNLLEEILLQHYEGNHTQHG